MLVGEVFARMGLDSRQYEKDLDKLEGKTQKKAMTLGGIFKGAFSFALGMGLMSGFRSLGVAITDFVNTAARTEVLDVAMQSVAKSSGYAISALREQRKSVMELGIAEQEASQILTRFMQAQLDTADAAKIARTAQDAAVIAGTNSSEAALTMTEAIAKLRPELLANYGMTRNLNDIYADYAKTAGKTAAQLSEAEKKQAMLNYILKEGEKIAGTYEASMGAVGKQIGSLPRYWDTLKNAIAKPLALPAISVIVDGITAGLKGAISWAEANKAALQMWGQTAANVAGFIVRGFQFVTRTFAENWGMIRFAATALLTYAVASRAAAGATALFQAISLALNGQLVAKIPLLSFVSTAMGIYKVQMALASAQGIVLTGVLAKVRVALFSVWSALGPVGWAILLLSGLVAGGVALWNRYTQSLQRTASTGMGDFRKAEEGLAASAGDSSKALDDQTKALDDQAKALNKAGKAAQKNLQPFDEINQLQKESAGGSGAGLPDMPTLGDLGGLGPIGGAGVDWGSMLDGLDKALEMPKATFKGFLGWLWKEWTDWVQSWNWVQKLSDWIVDTFYDETTGKWGLQKVWGNWEDWVQSWDWVQKLSDWIVDTFFDAEKGVWSLNKAWETFIVWAGGIWDSVKVKWNMFVEWVKGWDIWTWIGEKWNNFKEWVADMWDGAKDKWENFKTSAGEIWEGIKTSVSEKWNGLKTNASETWSSLKATIGGGWDAIKTKSGSTWDTVKTYVSNRWGDLKTGAASTWGTLKATVRDSWENIKQNTGATWENIRTTVSSKWDNLKTNASTTWSNISSTIQSKWNSLKSSAPGTWENIRSSIVGKWNSLNTSAGTIWNNIKNTISNRLSSIKNLFDFKWSLPRIKLPHFYVTWSFGGYLGKAAEFLGLPGIPRFSVSWYKEGGIFNQPSIIGVGEAGAEAVVPLDRLTELFASALRQVLSEERPAVAGAGGGDITIPIYIGNELLETIIVKAQDRRNTRSNGR